jgi:hypothetical protein
MKRNLKDQDAAFIWQLAAATNTFYEDSRLTGGLPCQLVHRQQVPTTTSPPAVAAPGPASPPGMPSRLGWDMSQMMWLAGGSGLQSVITRSNATMPVNIWNRAKNRWSIFYMFLDVFRLLYTYQYILDVLRWFSPTFRYMYFFFMLFRHFRCV